MKTMLIAVGLPRSGKSTKLQSMTYPIVNRDAIRLAIHGQPFIAETERLVSVIEDFMVSALFNAGHEIVSIDATHVSEKRRERWVRTAAAIGCAIIWVVFKTPKDQCIERAHRDGREDLIPVIERMDKYLLFPDDAPKGQFILDADHLSDLNIEL